MKNKDKNVNTLLNEEIKNLISEYLSEKSITRLLKINKYRQLFCDFIFWFEDTDFLKINQEDSQLLVSQKISTKLVILIAFIHFLSKDYREEAVRNFFEDLKLHEKFLLCLIVEEESLMSEKDVTDIIKNSKKYEEYLIEEQKRRQEFKKNKRKLIENFVNKNKEEIDKIFEDRIKYLFALRSQIVHRGSSVFIVKINSPRKHFFKSAIVEKYQPKKLERKILYFRDCKEPFEIILEELFLAALFRKKELSMKKLSLRIKNNLEYILNYFLKNESDIISLEQKKRIEEILKNS